MKHYVPKEINKDFFFQMIQTNDKREQWRYFF